MTEQAAVETRDLSKHYGSVRALQSVNLQIGAGEYFVLLGPSGGGKTTLLRTIGGFHKPTSGSVLLHGRDVSHLPPDKRPTSMVFQSYALFPHMTVMGNVSYGLSLTKMPKDQIQSKARAMLDMVGLSGYEERKPHELSGGQQQRVQLARSLVLDRDILLLDEPLAALDAQLRKDMCLELKHLQEKVGITFIHVTHNQEEAMTVADRIALIADGHLVEQGSAREIYERPQQRFTATFVGENNVMDGTVVSVANGHAVVDVAGTHLRAASDGQAFSAGDAVSLSIRSELMQTGEQEATTTQSGCAIGATFREAVYLGLTTSYRMTLDDNTDIQARFVTGQTSQQTVQPPAPGTRVNLHWNANDVRLHHRQ